MPSLGDFDTSTPAGKGTFEGPFKGVIEDAVLVKNDDGSPYLSAYGKHQIDVFVVVNPELTLKRRMSVSFGQMGNQYAALAELIQAALGIPCGDPKQRKVQLADLAGKPIGGMAVINERGYTDIIKWRAASKGAAKAELDDEIPF